MQLPLQTFMLNNLHFQTQLGICHCMTISTSGTFKGIQKSKCACCTYYFMIFVLITFMKVTNGLKTKTFIKLYIFSGLSHYACHQQMTLSYQDHWTRQFVCGIFAHQTVRQVLQILTYSVTSYQIVVMYLIALCTISLYIFNVPLFSQCKGLMHLPGRPVAAFDPEGLIFAAGINSESLKLYDLRSFDKVGDSIKLSN